MFNYNRLELQEQSDILTLIGGCLSALSTPGMKNVEVDSDKTELVAYWVGNIIRIEIKPKSER